MVPLTMDTGLHVPGERTQRGWTRLAEDPSSGGGSLDRIRRRSIDSVYNQRATNVLRNLRSPIARAISRGRSSNGSPGTLSLDPSCTFSRIVPPLSKKTPSRFLGSSLPFLVWQRSQTKKSQLSAAFSVLLVVQVATTIAPIVQPPVCTRTRTLRMTRCVATVLSRGSGRGYVTLIAGLDVPDGVGTTSLFIHCPVSWFTLRGLLMSWGLVPTGLRCGGGGGWTG